MLNQDMMISLPFGVVVRIRTYFIHENCNFLWLIWLRTMVKCFLNYSSSSIRNSLLTFLTGHLQDLRPNKFVRDAVYGAETIIICKIFCLFDQYSNKSSLLWVHCTFRGFICSGNKILQLLTLVNPLPSLNSQPDIMTPFRGVADNLTWPCARQYSLGS